MAHSNISPHYALWLIFKEEFNNLHHESGVPISDDIKNQIYQKWFENFKETDINLEQFSDVALEVREQAEEEYNIVEEEQIAYWNQLADDENARIVWLCGGNSSEIQSVGRGEIIENLDMYREKYKRFQNWKKIHNVMDVPDHFVASDFREWDEQIKTQEDYDSYVSDLCFYM